MRHTFYPTLFKRSGARFLTESDFPNTTNLYLYHAGSSEILDTAYGGVDLECTAGQGYQDGIDHIGNSSKCKTYAGAGEAFYYGNTSYDSSLTFPPDEDFSILAWVKLDDWSGTDQFTVAGFFNIDTDYAAFSTYDLVKLSGGTNLETIVDSTTTDNSVSVAAYSDYICIAITRNVTSTVTKLYINGSEVDSDNSATAWTVYEWLRGFSASISYSLTNNGYCSEMALHRGTIWTPSEISALTAIGAGT
jgi:hypothetical protein